MASESKVIRGEEFTWKEREREKYKEDNASYRSVHRYTLLGEGEGDLNFETRYFEVQPGGYTSFEYHRHPHSVIVIRGAGEVILGDEVLAVSPHDVVYVAPDTPHQFKAGEDTPLGFLCVVDRERDRPTLPDEQYIKDTIRSEEVRGKIER